MRYHSKEELAVHSAFQVKSIDLLRYDAHLLTARDLMQTEQTFTDLFNMYNCYKEPFFLVASEVQHLNTLTNTCMNPV